MTAVVVVGTQWGDEGKGKIVDFLARQADVVVRYQGGNNAGHTVVEGGQEFKLHLLPSGILSPGKRCLIASGVVVDPAVLVRELDELERRGVDTSGLRVSDTAHLIMPYHVRLDELEEERRGPNRIGTTRRGIGPAYMDKFARVGLRVQDLMKPERFRRRLAAVLTDKNHVLERVYGAPGFDLEDVFQRYVGYADRIRPFVADTSRILHGELAAGRRVLFEGAQGTLLDIDFGTYPFVTSSHPIAGGACVGAGVGPTRIDQVVGVVKAYTSRVGDGPFPTELHGELGQRIRDRGGEYGTTTGRPRRIGWLDLVIVRYAARISGISALAVNHLDTLAGLDTVKVCVAYRIGNRVTRDFPTDLDDLAAAEPVYEDLPGWSDAGEARAREYLDKISREVGAPVAIVSVGRERAQTLELLPVF